MSQVVRAFTGIFFLMLLTLLGSGIIGAQLESSYARDYKEAVVAELENSGLSTTVMNACMRQARENGYELTLWIYQTGKEPVFLDEETEEVFLTEETEMVEVLLNYDYSIPFLGYLSKHSLRGYAL